MSKCSAGVSSITLSTPAPTLADLDAAAAIARVLGNPTRLRVLDHLSRQGAGAVAELASELGVAGPRLSNHLAKLRSAGLVDVHRHGRHALYEVVGEGLSPVIAGLLAVRASVGSPTGRAVTGAEIRHEADTSTPGFRAARTCYDHLGGQLGVRVLQGLQHRQAMGTAAGDGDSIGLGPAAVEVFDRLGVDVAQLDRARRRMAFACLDATERAPHLGGAVGAALLGALVDRDWVRTGPGRRDVNLTPAGRQGLARVLDVPM